MDQTTPPPTLLIHKVSTMIARFSWPWGRISPDRRLEELDRMIRRHHATIKIIEAQAREAQRLHTKSIEALHHQKKIVEAFLDEDKRKSVMEQAYALESQGIPVLDRIASANSLGEIEEILQTHATKTDPDSLRTPPDGPKIFTPGESGVDLFNTGFDDTLDLFDHNPGDDK